ncbi:unnamed protein product, partial [Prorocentrum cordatum]
MAPEARPEAVGRGAADDPASPPCGGAVAAAVMGASADSREILRISMTGASPLGDLNVRGVSGGPERLRPWPPRPRLATAGGSPRSASAETDDEDLPRSVSAPAIPASTPKGLRPSVLGMPGALQRANSLTPSHQTDASDAEGRSWRRKPSHNSTFNSPGPGRRGPGRQVRRAR